MIITIIIITTITLFVIIPAIRVAGKESRKEEHEKMG